MGSNQEKIEVKNLVTHSLFNNIADAKSKHITAALHLPVG